MAVCDGPGWTDAGSASRTGEDGLMDTPSLTQVEAQRRSALIDVERYDIDVDFTGLLAGPQVRCISEVTFTCREPGGQTFVDCAAEVIGATLNGAELAPAEQGRIVLPDLAEHNTLRVESVQTNTADGEGVHRAVDPADGEVYVRTCLASDEGRFVWACFDQPDLKAPHAFTVTAPAAWTVLSNSGDPQIEALADARRWSFPPTPPLSTYNVVVNAGPFHEIRREVAGHDLGLFARRSLASVLDRDADELFTLTEQGLTFFADKFEMPFPQRKYDQVFMPEFGGAMENYGCVTWSDWFLFRAAPTPAERMLRAQYLLHELAHMWFGNVVTMRWWDDMWLNESFAEFAANWVAARATAFTDAWASHLVRGELSAYLLDQGPASHPIRLPVPDVAASGPTFDAITYPKGASALYQLMTYVGEDNFVAGLVDYFARHAWGNTTLADLIDTVTATSGRDLTAWVAGWLETAGTDRLTLDGSVLVARGPDGGAPSPQVLAIGAYRDDGGPVLTRTALVPVEVRQVRTPVELPPADVYLVNDDDLTFATTRSAALSPKLPSTIGRAVAVAEVWDRLITGEGTAAAAVRFVADVVRIETSGVVIERYLRLAADIAELWAPDSVRAELAAEVADVARALAEDPDHRLVALRTLARVGDPVAPPDDVDLRWRALVRRAELGADVTGDVQRLLEQDPDPESWVRALIVRAASPDADDKAAAWQRWAVDRTVPIGSVKEVGAAFWRPGQHDVLAPYTDRFVELLPELDRGGMVNGMEYGVWLFPQFGIEAADLPRVIAAAESAAPIVLKTVIERADVVQRMLQSRTPVSSEH